MSRINDKVHILGMSESGSTHMTVTSVPGEDGREVAVEPPIEVVFEGENTERIAVSQGGLTARYTGEELGLIGEGSSFAGLNRVIGEVAVSGPLEEGQTKPLHPTMTDTVIVLPVLTA